jgi:hypothetical protein
MPRTLPPRLPVGIVPRVESSRDQAEFLKSIPEARWVMVDIPQASRLVRDGVTAGRFFPTGEVITTSTVLDSTLARFHFDRELEVVRKFAPAWHIPCDRPVYIEDSPRGRRGLIDDCVRGTIEFKAAVADSGIGLIPLIKGVNPAEWRYSFDALSRAGFGWFSLYVKQYFGGGLGRRVAQMISDVRSLVAGCGMEYLFLVGFQSLARQPELPPAVRGFAGQAWRRQSKLGRVTPAEARLAYRSWVRNGKQLGRSRQDVLHDEAVDASVGGA